MSSPKENLLQAVDDTAVITILSNLRQDGSKVLFGGRLETAPTRRVANLLVRVKSTMSLISSKRPGISNRASQLYLTLLNVFVTFGISDEIDPPGWILFQSRLVSAFVRLVDQSESLDDSKDTIIAAFKNAHDIYFADMVQDAEVRSEVVAGGRPWQTLYTGILRRILRRQLAKGGARGLSFATSLVMSKIGWPELQNFSRAKATIKSAVAFGRRVVDFQVGVAKQIASTSRLIFGQFSASGVSPKFALDKMSPSTNASLLAPRKTGGTYQHFDAMPVRDERIILRARGPLNEVVVKMKPSLAELSNQLSHHKQNMLNASFPVASAMSAAQESENIRNPMSMMWIPEPAKFRGIGLGPGVKYTALQPLQGQLLSAWKKRGESTMVGDLDEKVNTLVRRAREIGFSSFVSGDFEAASDMMSSWSGAVAINALKPHPMAELARESLYNNRLTYPSFELTSEVMELVREKNLVEVLHIFKAKAKGVGEWGRLVPLSSGDRASFLDGKVVEMKKDFVIVGRIIVPQLNGQPMGHPISFPILCVVNLACYYEAVAIFCDLMKIHPEVRAKIKQNVLVNGDDILFAADRPLYEIWKKVVRSAGLVPSLGKNYFCSNFLMINSKRYLITSQGARLCSYLNLRIVNGVSLKKGDSSATPEMIGEEINAMITGCSAFQGWIPGIFSRFKYPELAKVNWYLPVHLGGFGVDVRYAPPNLVFTEWQLKLAAWYVCSPHKLALFRMGEAESDKKRIPWITSRLARLAPIMLPRGVSQQLEPFDYHTALPFSGVTPTEEPGGEAESWFARALQINKAILGKDAYEAHPAFLYAVRQSVKTRLQPMSCDGVLKWWFVDYVERALPSLPPSPQLQIPNVSQRLGDLISTDTIRLHISKMLKHEIGR